MNTNTIDIMNKGMRCLQEKLGIVEAERFISIIIREQFDYTRWQQEYFDAMTQEQINNEAKQYINKYPFKGNAKVIL